MPIAWQPSICTRAASGRSNPRNILPDNTKRVTCENVEGLGFRTLCEKGKPDMTEDANEVEVVYTTNDVYEAEIIRNQLHDAGIKCELDGESQGGLPGIVETKVLVRAEDAGRARHLIDRRTTDRFESPRDEV